MQGKVLQTRGSRLEFAGQLVWGRGPSGRRGSNNATSGCPGRSLHTLRSVTRKLRGYTVTNQKFIHWRLEMTMGPVCAFPPFLLSSKIKSCLQVFALFTTAVPYLLIDSLNPNSQSKGVRQTFLKSLQPWPFPHIPRRAGCQTRSVKSYFVNLR